MQCVWFYVYVCLLLKRWVYVLCYTAEMRLFLYDYSAFLVKVRVLHPNLSSHLIQYCNDHFTVSKGTHFILELTWKREKIRYMFSVKKTNSCGNGVYVLKESIKLYNCLVHLT